MYYIYEYVDPRTNVPFYVGKGKGNRRFNHLRETAENTDNRRKYFIIKSLTQKGLTPIINIIEADIEDQNTAYDREDYYILKYGRIGYEENGTLTNVCLNNKPPTLIGEANGMYGKTQGQHVKDAVSHANKGRTAWNKGIAQSQHVKDAVSLANTGKTPHNKGKERTVEEKKAMKDGWAKKIENGYTPHNKGKTVPKDHMCENCGRSLSKQNYNRWHGPKCKRV